MDDQRPKSELPPLPYSELRAAIEHDPEALARLDALNEHLGSDTQDREHVAGHVNALRGISAVEARIANWWESPATQSFFNNLTNAGL